jgi:hypothetical protein
MRRRVLHARRLAARPAPAYFAFSVVPGPLFSAAAGVVIGPPTATAGLALVSAVFALALGWPVVFVTVLFVPVLPLPVLLREGAVLSAPVFEAPSLDLPLHAASAAAITTTLHAILLMPFLPWMTTILGSACTAEGARTRDAAPSHAHSRTGSTEHRRRCHARSRWKPRVAAQYCCWNGVACR